MPLELKPEWIIKNPDGTETINPAVLDDMATAIKALQSIHTGRINGPHSHGETVEVMRQIAGEALAEIGGGFEPLQLLPAHAEAASDD